MKLVEGILGGSSRGALIREGVYGAATLFGVLIENPAVIIAAFALMLGAVGAHGVANAREESRRINTQLVAPRKSATA